MGLPQQTKNLSKDDTVICLLCYSSRLFKFRFQFLAVLTPEYVVFPRVKSRMRSQFYHGVPWSIKEDECMPCPANGYFKGLLVQFMYLRGAMNVCWGVGARAFVSMWVRASRMLGAPFTGALKNCQQGSSLYSN